MYQNKPLGTGDAVLKCEKYIKDSHFLLLLPDDLIINKNCSKEMISLHKKTKSNIIASKKVKKKKFQDGVSLNWINYIKIILLSKVLLKSRLSKNHHQIMLLLEDIYFQKIYLKYFQRFLKVKMANIKRHYGQW